MVDGSGLEPALQGTLIHNFDQILATGDRCCGGWSSRNRHDEGDGVHEALTDPAARIERIAPRRAERVRWISRRRTAAAAPEFLAFRYLVLPPRALEEVREQCQLPVCHVLS